MLQEQAQSSAYSRFAQRSSPLSSLHDQPSAYRTRVPGAHPRLLHLVALHIDPATKLIPAFCTDSSPFQFQLVPSGSPRAPSSPSPSSSFSSLWAHPSRGDTPLAGRDQSLPPPPTRHLVTTLESSVGAMDADTAQQMFAPLAAMMREQQQFLSHTAELQQQMAATLQQQQQVPPPQHQQVDAAPTPDTREYCEEGIIMPTFHGMKDDDVADYMFSARLYFDSKNIQYGDDAPQQRPLSLLVANLKGPAAAWYRKYVSHEGNFLQSVAQFEELLTSEFTAPDKQEHLRDQLLRLRQKYFACLEDDVSSFRNIMCKVEDMSDIESPGS
ncbi:unnamed protein product [Phytophthora lilii]|uniref:Unnamed protein product n=1 Tax=Phytophthora lilii TaxID=2077276 RepID=A0A9W6WIZ5_9STRA|nr:unnamed protein product [Phytophthora lilii]